jgi:hypothetical protein
MIKAIKLIKKKDWHTTVVLILLASINYMYAAKPNTISIIHPHDNVIHAYYADDLAGEKLDKTGLTDVSRLLNKAIKELFEKGGGTLYLPAGKYRLDKPIFIRPGTALRGDFVEPTFTKVDVKKNTILCAYYGRNMDEQSKPLIFLDGSGLIDGIVFWYPEQISNEIVPYAPTIRHDNKDAKWGINSASRNIYFVNAFTGIQLGKEGRGTCIQLMKNIYGTPLENGIEVWRDADIPRILNINFNPEYWLTAGLDNKAPNHSIVKEFVLNNASGVTYHRSDGSALVNINVKGYHIGLKLGNGHQQSNESWLDNEGHYVNFNITDCYYAVWLNNIKNHGTQFYNSKLKGIHSAVFIENPMHGKECAMFIGCELEGGKASISQSWEGKPNDLFSFMFSSCVFNSTVDWTGGNLSIVDSDFNFVGKHLKIGPDVRKVIISDSRFTGLRTIENKAGSKLFVNNSKEKYIVPPAYVYDVNKISTYIPSRSKSVFVKAGNGKKDDVERLQKIIDNLSTDGGGFVVLSTGFYVLNKTLVIKKNVELRGQIQSWQHSKFLSYYAEQNTPKGAVIFVEYGKDKVDSKVITLEENAGLDGLFFHYRDQEFNSETKEVMHTFSWLIQMKGDRSYVKHVTASNPWRFIDINTYSPKDTYVGYCTGAPLNQGIHVGEAENCMLDNVHFNSWYWNTVYFPNTIVKSKVQRGFKLELDNWMKANTEGFIFSGSKNIDVYGSFIFCSRKGFSLLPGKNTGKGPSGIIVNSGCDWSKFGLYMKANNGLTFVNTHLIDVGENDPDLNISSIYVSQGCEDQISFYNLSTWGTSHRAFAMFGTSSSQVDVYNFSYQLYYTQMNDINQGKVQLINAIRNVPKNLTTFKMGTEAKFRMQNNVFAAGLKVTPISEKNNFECYNSFFNVNSSRRMIPSHNNKHKVIKGITN